MLHDDSYILPDMDVDGFSDPEPEGTSSCLEAGMSNVCRPSTSETTEKVPHASQEDDNSSDSSRDYFSLDRGPKHLSTLDLGVNKFRFADARGYSSSSSEEVESDADQETERVEELNLEQDRSAIALRAAILANDKLSGSLDAIEAQLTARLAGIRQRHEPRPIRTAIYEGSDTDSDDSEAPEWADLRLMVPYRALSPPAGPPPNAEQIARVERRELDFASLPKRLAPWSNTDKRKLAKVVQLVSNKQKREIRDARAKERTLEASRRQAEEAVDSRKQGEDSRIQDSRIQDSSIQDSRIQAVDSRKQAEESRIQAVDSRIQAEESRIQAVDSRIQAGGSRIQGEDSRIQAVDSRKQAEESRIQAVDSRIQAGGSRKQTIELNHQPLASKKRALAKEDSEMVCLSEQDYDWGLIAHWFRGKHSALECRAMWLHHVMVGGGGRAKAWEKARLRQIAQAHMGRDWDEIARELGTGRSALQCFVMDRAARKDEPSPPWTPEEDLRLKQLVEEHRTGHFINWYAIVYRMPGRDMKHIVDHWRVSADPNIKKGRFSESEDRLMIEGIRKHGLRFTRIARQFLPWRTGPQLRDHHINTGPKWRGGGSQWSSREDARLTTLVGEVGNDWRRVSEHFVMPARSRLQCRNRYVTLMKQRAAGRVGSRGSTRRGGRRASRLNRLAKVNERLETFITANFVEGREGKRHPGSIRAAFELSECEISQRAAETRRALAFLGAELTGNERSLQQAVSVSNQDKAVFACAMRDSNPGPPQSSVAHTEFLLPDVEMLDGLLNVLLDPRMHRENKPATKRKRLRGKASEDTKELKAAKELWMERLKTIFLYSILVPGVEQGEDTEEEEIEIETEEKGKVEEDKVKRSVGRPRKKRRRKPPPPEYVPPPKREYKRTGLYSKGRDVGRRASSSRIKPGLVEEPSGPMEEPSDTGPSEVDTRPNPEP